MYEYLRILLKARWKAFFIPVIVALLFLICFSYYIRYLYIEDIETVKMYVAPDFHLVISLLSAWWGILTATEYVSVKGNEVLYMYFSLKSVMICQLIMEIVYIVGVTVFFLLTGKDFGFTNDMLALLIGESIFISGLAFGITQLTKNTSIALCIVVFYCVYLLKFDFIDALRVISIFQDTVASTSSQSFIVDVGFGIFFHFIGGVCYKTRKVYF